MQKYLNTKCPVCNKEFIEGDDIVTCPECGTPHHRECYNMIGHCVNRGLHESGYTYAAEAKTTEEQPAKVGEYYSPTDKKESAPQESPLVFPADIGKEYNTYKDSTEKIGEYEIGDIAATVRNNVPHFVDKFKKIHAGKKTSWNWGAFFFGGFYYLFRKMYKQGSLFLSIETAILFGCKAAIAKFAPKYIATITDIANTYSADQSAFDPSIVQNIPQTDTAVKIVYATFAVLLVIRIISSLFANKFYKKNVEEIIDSVNKQLDEGASFTQNTMIMGNISELNQEQMRKMYLSRKGGVSMFAPLMGYFAIFILTTFL